MSLMENLKTADPAVAEAIDKELNRQRTKLELIASENIVSKAVLEAQGSVLTNKHAEKSQYVQDVCAGGIRLRLAPQPAAAALDQYGGNAAAPGMTVKAVYRFAFDGIAHIDVRAKLP